jgi:hypothetical protein
LIENNPSVDQVQLAPHPEPLVLPSPGGGQDCPCPELQVAGVSCSSDFNRFLSLQPRFSHSSVDLVLTT